MDGNKSALFINLHAGQYVTSDPDTRRASVDEDFRGDSGPPYPDRDGETGRGVGGGGGRGLGVGGGGRGLGYG